MMVNHFRWRTQVLFRLLNASLITFKALGPPIPDFCDCIGLLQLITQARIKGSKGAKQAKAGRIAPVSARALSVEHPFPTRKLLRRNITTTVMGHTRFFTLASLLLLFPSLLVQHVNGLYFYLQAGETRCFLEELPASTIVLGKCLKG